MKSLIEIIIKSIGILVLLLFSLLEIKQIGISWQLINCYLLVATFVVLWWYSFESHLLRKTTVEQKELQIQPLLIIDFMKQEGRDGLFLKNIGNGVAMRINIKDKTVKIEGFEFILNSENMNWLDKGDSKLLKTLIKIDGKEVGDDSFPWAANLNPRFANSNYEFKISYENIQHVKYETLVSTGKSGVNIKYWGKLRK